MPSPRSLLTVLFATVMTLSACSAITGEEEVDPSQFSVTFTRIGAPRFMDMSLVFNNPTDTSVIIEGRLVAHDASGAVLPEVEVTSAFGTELGRAVLVPGESVDFVQLDGAGEQQVRDITLETASVEATDVPPEAGYVNMRSVDRDGQDIDYDNVAHSVIVENPNPFEVRVRLVLLVLDSPRSGTPQEATLVLDLTTVEVTGYGSRVVPLDEQTRRILRQQGSSSPVTLRGVLEP